MEKGINETDRIEGEKKESDVSFSSEKDFYKGVKGELRFKAEGLFKKAKEKGISIEDVKVTTIKENKADFPGLGSVELPTYFVMVKGRHITSGQTMVDGKLIDYYNRYQKYIAERLFEKNAFKDERGKKVYEDKRIKLKIETEFVLNEAERFEIGRDLVDDKEFGVEKTITGACDRVIRKLMGENDWLYPEEARLLDEEFNNVQKKISLEHEVKGKFIQAEQKRATERQMNYFKARVKNSGLDPENEIVIKEILRQCGIAPTNINEITTADMSKLIDSVNKVVPSVKAELAKGDYSGNYSTNNDETEAQGLKQ